VLVERMIVGTAPRVIDRLKELEEELGLDGILAELNPGSLVPHQNVMTALRLLCEEVMPAFR
jgi:alkanesulfonate monooxygenase SsuD/methylene tetrahydromethanopterin reductase-like flavin-dependent oxidoreductase (luciferase family)